MRIYASCMQMEYVVADKESVIYFVFSLSSAIYFFFFSSGTTTNSFCKKAVIPSMKS